MVMWSRGSAVFFSPLVVLYVFSFPLFPNVWGGDDGSCWLYPLV